ncbi:acyl-CoA dehydrogenase family protein, partial [Nocardioides sp.]|uniref:acyl-CoA dehydrogenase family protein n=1 Tax=Nocardioides sp. TaxID=35761 RepID=UPI0039E3DCDB
MSLLNSLKGGGRFGVASTESRDPLGVLVAGLSQLAQSPLLDRLGVRRQTEQTVFTVTRGGFKVATRAGRTFARAGNRGKAGTRPPAASRSGVFDLTPTEDEQMLVDVVGEFAEEIVRPAAAEANESCLAPESVLKASLEIGLPILGVPESLGGVYEERSAMAGTLVAEALAKGDLGLAVATLAPGAVATALGLWGTDEQQQTYLPALAEGVAAALALNEPTVLFDVLSPATTATRKGSGYVLSGTKSLVARGADAELFVVGASLDGRPALFLVESATPGLSIEGDPAMGVRAAGLTTLTLTDVEVAEDAVLG